MSNPGMVFSFVAAICWKSPPSAFGRHQAVSVLVFDGRKHTRVRSRPNPIASHHSSIFSPVLHDSLVYRSSFLSPCNLYTRYFPFPREMRWILASLGTDRCASLTFCFPVSSPFPLPAPFSSPFPACYSAHTSRAVSAAASHSTASVVLWRRFPLSVSMFSLPPVPLLSPFLLDA